jgi:cytochrome c peroxidase
MVPLRTNDPPPRGLVQPGAATSRNGAWRRIVTFAFLLGVTGAQAALPLQPLTRVQADARAAALLALGKHLFGETALSASGTMSCASCHDPRYAFTPANARPVQQGGVDAKRWGTRAVATLMYLQAAFPFTEHYRGAEEDGALDGVDQGPAGGLTWDGRVDRGHAQAAIPLLSAQEMANASTGDVAARVLRAGYGAKLKAIFGDAVTARPADVFEGVTAALEAYEQDPSTFFPYSSKFDAYLDERAVLSAPEARGLAAFNDPARGNCAVCHRDTLLPNGGHPDLTDFGMVSVGVPRNPQIPANRDPNYFDLGLCGPYRTDLRGSREYCGMFKAPTLRNVAVKKSFFHNGVVHDLRAAVAFYAERDLAPARWYKRAADGGVVIYDDLPPSLRVNVNKEPPFDRVAGERAALSAQDIDDVVAFLRTLTDGYRVGSGR